MDAGNVPMEMGPIGERGGPDQEPPSSYSRPAAVWTGPRLMRQIGRDRRDRPHPPGRGSIPPEILEPRGAQLCVARGVRVRHVAEPILDRPGIARRWPACSRKSGAACGSGPVAAARRRS